MTLVVILLLLCAASAQFAPNPALSPEHVKLREEFIKVVVNGIDKEKPNVQLLELVRTWHEKERLHNIQQDRIETTIGIILRWGMEAAWKRICVKLCALTRLSLSDLVICS